MLDGQELGLVRKFPIKLVLQSEKASLPELSWLTVPLLSIQPSSLGGWTPASGEPRGGSGLSPDGLIGSWSWLSCRWPVAPLGSSLSRGYESF